MNINAKSREYGEMEAGRECDALVAEKVMGWTHGTYTSDGVDYLRDPITHESHLYPPSYSTDIRAAYQMEEKIKELELTDEYCMHLNAIANAHWDKDAYLLHRQPQRWQLIHATPEDRCRAALLTIHDKRVT